MKNIFLLGATGSIGTQVLEIIKDKDYCVKSVACGKNIKRMIEIIEEFKPEYVSVKDESDMIELKNKYPEIKFGYGEKGLVEAATYSNLEGIVINAVVGIAGLEATVASIKAKRDVLLANKETLVVAGDIINKLLKEYNVKLIPIDSEHNAILRLINQDKLKRVIITASGGAFKNKTRDELDNVTIDDALNHPNWSMGAKITVDCATMVNKGLEVMEAHHLFGLDYDMIDTIVHPESIIHSMVEYNDKSVLALMYQPTMLNPIQHALLGNAEELNLPSVDFEKLGSLTFRKMDYERYPMIKLAYKVGKMGGIMPLVYNASNEIAVKLFLDGKIKFLEIENIITNAVNKYTSKNNFYINNELEFTIENLLRLDKMIRKEVLDEVNK